MPPKGYVKKDWRTQWQKDNPSKMKIELFFADGAKMVIECEETKREYYLELARDLANKDKNNTASLCYM